jgi:hypothetical protein
VEREVSASLNADKAAFAVDPEHVGGRLARNRFRKTAISEGFAKPLPRAYRYCSEKPTLSKEDESTLRHIRNEL